MLIRIQINAFLSGSGSEERNGSGSGSGSGAGIEVDPDLAKCSGSGSETLHRSIEEGKDLRIYRTIWPRFYLVELEKL